MNRLIHVATVIHATAANFYAALTLEELFEKVAKQFVLPNASDRTPGEAAAIADACEHQQWQEAITIYFASNEDEMWAWGSERLSDEIAERLEIVCESHPNEQIVAALEALPDDDPSANDARTALESWLRARDVTLNDLHYEPPAPDTPDPMPEYFPASLPPASIGRQPPLLRLV